jgi:hypothetical protein
MRIWIFPLVVDFMLIFDKRRFLLNNLSPTGMPSGNNQLQWLQSRSNLLLSEIEELSTSTNDPAVAEALGKVVELMQINQQLQGIYAIHLLTSLEQSEMEIDDQLNEIAGYMESIVLSRQREAENLRKIQ